MKKIIIVLLCIVIVTIGVYSNPSKIQAQECVANRRIPILVYHYIRDAADDLSVLPTDFEAQMQYLHDNGFNTVNTKELKFLQDSGALVPCKTIMITFDDGHRGQYAELGFIKTLNSVSPSVGKPIKFTSFLVTDWVGADTAWLTWAKALEMQKTGFFEFQSHTQTHPHGTQITLTQWATELDNANNALKTNLDTFNWSLAYPYGEYNSNTRLELKWHGIYVAFTTVNAIANLDTDIQQALPRIGIFKSTTLADFTTIVNTK